MQSCIGNSNETDVVGSNKTSQAIKTFHEYQQQMHRTRARWYYPMDHRYRMPAIDNDSDNQVSEYLDGIWYCHSRKAYRRILRKFLRHAQQHPWQQEKTVVLTTTNPETLDQSTETAAAAVALDSKEATIQQEDMKQEQQQEEQQQQRDRQGRERPARRRRHRSQLGTQQEMGPSSSSSSSSEPDNEDNDDNYGAFETANEFDHDDDDQKQQPAKKKGKTSRYVLLRCKKANDWNSADPLYDEDFQKERSIALLDHARLTMLEIAKKGEWYNIPFTLSGYRMFDHSYIPGLYGRKLLPKLVFPFRFQNSRLFAQERRDHADPSYLAPFSMSSLLSSATPTTRNKSKQPRRKIHPIDRNDPNSPALYGNCLVCVPCPCRPCRLRRQDNMIGWCLLHPTGDLLDRVRVSRLVLPHDAAAAAESKDRPRRIPKDTAAGAAAETKDHPRRKIHDPSSSSDLAELDLGDTIRQLDKCGLDNNEGETSSCCLTFVARTACYVVVFRLVAAEKCSNDIENNNNVSSSLLDPTTDDDDGTCWCYYKLEKLHVVDLRPADNRLPYFKPIDITCHPKFGPPFSDRTMAILSHTETTRNTIHHVLANDDCSWSPPPLIATHHIACLKSISLIEFTTAHPMTLWAAANSFVQPVITENLLRDGPYTGNGHSLYCIDLRINSNSAAAATFQWSPSAEEYLTEGVHSISGILSDWDRPHRVWVSSISAAKTWELDSRMPCKVVSSWSLPSLCDDFESFLPPSGLHGNGTMMVKPSLPYPTNNNYGSDTVGGATLISVGKCPGTFGLHVYQSCHDLQPRFQTSSLEIAGRALPSDLGGSCYVASSMFPLVDVSDKVFSCGLAAFRTSTEAFMTKAQVFSLGFNVEEDDASHILSTITMTSKGDIYLHALLEHQGGIPPSAPRIQDALPFGCTALKPPMMMMSSSSRRKSNNSRTNHAKTQLVVSLSSTPPLPSSACISPQVVKTRADIHPFKSIRMLKERPAMTTTTQPRDDWQPLSHARQAPNPFVVVNERKEEESITKENQLLYHPPASCDVSDTVTFGELKTNPETMEAPRSDVTCDVLQTAALLWDEDS